MQFNDHQEKYKMSDLRGIHGEQFRELPRYNNYVDPSRTHLNVTHVFNPELESGDWYKRVLECKRIHEKTTGKALRKDAVVFISDIATVPREWPIETALKYFEERNYFMKSFLENHGVKKEFLLSGVVHMDETEPHQTIVYMPFKNGKFQAKSIMTQTMLKQLQRKAYEFYLEFESKHPEIGEHKLEPYVEGSIGSKKKHLSELDYKIKKDTQKVELLKEEKELIEENISNKQEELISLEEKIIENPIIKLTDECQIKKEVAEMDNELSKIKKQHSNQKLETEIKIPRYEKSNWLESNVEYVEAKKDFFGKEKEPAHVKIEMEEWNSKVIQKKSNDAAFLKLSSMYKSLLNQYKDIKQILDVELKKVNKLAKYISRTLDNVLNLPVSAKWKEIRESKNENVYLENKLQETYNAYIYEKSEKNWYKKFYGLALKILYRSTTPEGYNSLDSVTSKLEKKEVNKIWVDLQTIIKDTFTKKASRNHDLER